MGNLSERPAPNFHRLTTRVSGMEVYADSVGYYYRVNDENILIHKRPETTTPAVEKKMVKDYIRKDFKTRGEALDYFDTEGNTLYVPNTPEYTVANEMDMLDSFGQLFVLEEREQTWQDTSQEFIRNDPVLSRDQFVEDMFGAEFKEYHKPLKKLAQIIVENTK